MERNTLLEVALAPTALFLLGVCLWHTRYRSTGKYAIACGLGLAFVIAVQLMFG